MIADLHCHSTASDGALSPRDLLRRASDGGVELLAITDHDTVDAYAGLDRTHVSGMRVVPGVEFSAQWRGCTIHIVGLGIDLDSPVLATAIDRQQAARAERAEVIAARLNRLGLDDALAGARRIAGDTAIGRPHFAKFLLESGRVKSISAAFKKYLGPGKPGDVKHFWPPIDEVVGWIRAAGGTAVIAHPGKYKLTNTRLGLLVDEFAEHGGQAIEVLCGRQAPDLTKKLATICNDRSLYASCGSDFHVPDQPWSELGRCGPLPPACRPVWELL